MASDHVLAIESDRIDSATCCTRRSTVSPGIGNDSRPKGVSTTSSKPIMAPPFPNRRTPRFMRKYVWIVLAYGMLVWDNLHRGGILITDLSTVDFPDSPMGHWTTNERTMPYGNSTPSRGVEFPNGGAFILSDDPLDLSPDSLKRGIDLFLRDYRNVDPSFSSTSGAGGDGLLWNLLENYPSGTSKQQQQQQHKTVLEGEPAVDPPSFYYEHDELSSEIVCGAGPGQGMEQAAGYKLLMEKIRIRESIATNTISKDPKLLCLVYTHSPMRYLSRAQALLWGKDCDGFVAFSNEHLPELGIYQLPGHTDESYHNMWQKSRLIWKQVHNRYLDHYDYFYLSGDDVYLLVENLRAYLRELEATNNTEARHFGSWLPNRLMIAGGPGYVLNRAALQKYFEPKINNSNASNNSTESVWSTCLANARQSYEDRFLSICLSQELGIWGNATDTRNALTGEQRFHDTDPATLYLNRAGMGKSYFAKVSKAWEDQPMPGTSQSSSSSTMVGPKHGLEAAAKDSISLHKIYSPIYMARIHAILHPEVCPIDSSLGRGLKLHGLPEP